MKILVRQLNQSTNYAWQDAVYKDGMFYIGSEDERVIVNQTNILAIQDDNRKDSVMCQNCGAIIKNNPEAIEAHFREIEEKRNCFECGSLKRAIKKSVKAEFTETNDGAYTVTETYIARLKCGNAYWNSPDITSEEAKKICTFYRCRNYGVRPVKDIFTEYPDPFGKQITVDTLVERKFACEVHTNGFFEYDLKCRNMVKACVNELGIVDHFIVKHRNHRWLAYYSDKYNMLFFTDNGRDYCLTRPSDISQTKYNQALEKIASLYKEEEDK